MSIIIGKLIIKLRPTNLIRCRNKILYSNRKPLSVGIYVMKKKIGLHVKRYQFCTEDVERLNEIGKLALSECILCLLAATL